MVALGQITALLDFMERHPELALGHLSRGMEGRSKSKRLWQECATILNSLDENGVQKTWTEWRTFFNDYKSKLSRKLSDSKKERSATGGGQAKKLILSPNQERLHEIMGKDVGEPLPNVRHNPIEKKTAPCATETRNYNSKPSSPLLGVEVASSEANVIIPNYLDSEYNIQYEVTLNEDGDDDGEGVVRSRSPLRYSPPLEDPQKTHQKAKHSEKNYTRACTALEVSQAKLENIETKKTNAINEQANAINNQAIAINRLAAAIEEFSKKIGEKKKKIETLRLPSSESDSD